MGENRFSIDDAAKIGMKLGVDFGKTSLREFQMGLEVELEHGTQSRWDVTGDDPILTGKIAAAHLEEMPDYYTRLARMEKGELPRNPR